MPALSDYYDELWVYGLPQICDPLEGIDLPASVRRRMVYTGYLRREVPATRRPPGSKRGLVDGDFLLVTPGGGGDGEELIDWVLAAYENDPGALPAGADRLSARSCCPSARPRMPRAPPLLDKVRAITFDARLEALMARAKGVVAMGGYNTFCEILSFDKPALILPRTVPRLEQYIRARRAAELGLVTMLSDENARDPARMAAALLQLTQQAPPSSVVVPGLLDGMPNVNKLAAQMARPRPSAALRLAAAAQRMSRDGRARAASPLSSKATRGCRRPLSRRRSSRSNSAGSTS